MLKEFVDIDGIKTCYIEAGEGKAVIFLHGWLGSSIDFPALFPFLAKRFRCIALDLPGFGETQTLPQEPSMENYAEFVRRFVKQLDIGDHSVVGNCYGAALALEYVLLNPEGLKKAVLLTPVFFGDIMKKKWSPVLWLLGIRPVRKTFSWLSHRDLFMDNALKLILRKRRRQYFLDAKRKKQQADHETAYKVLRDLKKVEYRDKLKGITLPIFIMVFEADGYLDTNRIITTGNLLPNVKYHIVRDKGHLSNPDHLLSDYESILSFLES